MGPRETVRFPKSIKLHAIHVRGFACGIQQLLGSSAGTGWKLGHCCSINDGAATLAGKGCKPHETTAGFDQCHSCLDVRRHLSCNVFGSNSKATHMKAMLGHGAYHSGVPKLETLAQIDCPWVGCSNNGWKHGSHKYPRNNRSIKSCSLLPTQFPQGLIAASAPLKGRQHI